MFERDTGEELATLHDFDGDLDDPVSAGVPDTMHVMLGGAAARLSLPRDRRPVAEILEDLDCRIPLRVRGVALHVAPTTCPGAPTTK